MADNDWSWLLTGENTFLKLFSSSSVLIYIVTGLSWMPLMMDDFFLGKDSEGQFYLQHKHAYYYQIQLQMKLCKVQYGDFVVWGKTELVILRINLDEDFISEAIRKAALFVKYGVLPELIGKWYTRKVSMSNDAMHFEESEIPSASEEKRGGVTAMVKKRER